jgi:hypothetical protein
MPSPASTAGRAQPVGAGRYPGRPRVDGAPTGRTGATGARLDHPDHGGIGQPAGADPTAFSP